MTAVAVALRAILSPSPPPTAESYREDVGGSDGDGQQQSSFLLMTSQDYQEMFSIMEHTIAEKDQQIADLQEKLLAQCNRGTADRGAASGNDGGGDDDDDDGQHYDIVKHKLQSLLNQQVHDEQQQQLPMSKSRDLLNTLNQLLLLTTASDRRRSSTPQELPSPQPHALFSAGPSPFEETATTNGGDADDGEALAAAAGGTDDTLFILGGGGGNQQQRIADIIRQLYAQIADIDAAFRQSAAESKVSTAVGCDMTTPVLEQMRRQAATARRERDQARESARALEEMLQNVRDDRVDMRQYRSTLKHTATVMQGGQDAAPPPALEDPEHPRRKLSTADGALKDPAAVLLQKLHAAHARIASLETQLAPSLRTETDTGRDTATAAADPQAVRYRDMLARAEALVAEKSRLVETLRAKVAELQRIRAPSADAAAVRAGQAERDTMRDEMSAAEELLEAQAAHIADLEAVVASGGSVGSRGAAAQVEELTARICSLQAANTVLSDRIEEITAAAESKGHPTRFTDTAAAAAVPQALVQEQPQDNLAHAATPREEIRRTGEPHASDTAAARAITKDLQQRCERLTADVAAHRDSASTANAQAAALREQTAALGVELGDARARLEAAAAEHARLLAGAEDRERHLANVHAQATAAVEERLLATQQRCAQLQDDSADLAAKVAQCLRLEERCRVLDAQRQRALDDHREAVQYAEELKRSLNALTAELSDQRHADGHASKTADDARAERERSAALRARCDDLESQLMARAAAERRQGANLQDAQRQLQDMHAQWIESDAGAQKLRAQLRDTQARVDQRDEEASEARAAIQSSLRGSERHLGAVALALRDGVEERMQTFNARLHTVDRALAAARDDGEVRAEAAAAEAARLQRQNASLGKQVSAGGQTLADVAQQLQRRTSELRAQQRKVADLDVALGHSQSVTAALRADLERIGTEGADKQQALADARRQRDEALLALEAARRGGSNDGARVQELSAECEALRARLQHLDSDNAAMSERLADALQTELALRQQLEAATAMCEKSELRYSKLKDTHETVSAKLDILQKSIHSKSNLVREVSTQFEDALAEKASMTQRLQHALAEGRELQACTGALEQKLRDAQSTAEDRDAQLDGAAAAMGCARADLVARTAAAVQHHITVQAQLAVAEKERAELQARVSSEAGSARTLSQQLQTADALVAELQAGLSAAATALQAKSAACDGASREAAQLRETVDALERALARKTVEVDALRAENASNARQQQQDADSASTHRKRFESLACKLIEVEREKRQLESRLLTVRVELEEAAGRQQQLRRESEFTEHMHVTRLELAQAELHSLRQLVQTKTKTGDSEVAYIKEQLQLREGQATVLGIANADLKKRVETLHADNSRLKDTMKELDSRTALMVETMKLELKEVSEQYTHYEQLAAELNQVNEDLRQEVQQSQSDAASVRDEFAAVRRQLDAASTQLVDLKALRADLEKKLSVAVAATAPEQPHGTHTSSSNTATAADLERQVRAAILERQQVLDAMDKLADSYKRHEVSRKQLKMQLKALQEELTARVAENDRLRQGIIDLQREKKFLSADMDKRSHETNFVMRKLNEAANALKADQSGQQLQHPGSREVEMQVTELDHLHQVPKNTTTTAAAQMDEVVQRYERKLDILYRLLEKGERALQTGADILRKSRGVKNAADPAFAAKTVAV